MIVYLGYDRCPVCGQPDPMTRERAGARHTDKPNRPGEFDNTMVRCSKCEVTTLWWRWMIEEPWRMEEK